jgi:hypothetical protein
LTTKICLLLLKKLALANQKLQGNRIDSYKRLGTTKSKGGFNVKESVEGPLFWADVKKDITKVFT